MTPTRALLRLLQFGTAAAAWLLSPILSAEDDSPKTKFTETDLPLPMWSQEEWQKLARESAPAPLGGLLPGLGEDPSAALSDLGPALSPKYADAPPRFSPTARAL